jgi:rod shape-determining protein MreC
MPRNRSTRAAVLGSTVQRSGSQPYSSQKASAVKRRAVVGVLVVLALALITLSFRSSGLTPVQDAGATVLRPFQVAAARIASPFRDAGGWARGLVDAKSENKRLRRQVDELRRQVYANEDAARQNEELRKLLRYVDSPRFPQDYDYVPTSVISPPQSTYEQTIVIAAGRADGVRPEDPVVTADGLVGHVTTVGRDVAKVMLLTDESSAAAAVDLEQPGAVGTVKHGQGSANTLILDRVGKEQKVSEGDPIITAGSPPGSELPSIYPRGVQIGLVTGVGQKDTDLYKQIQVQPFVDFSSLRSVLVLVPKTR